MKKRIASIFLAVICLMVMALPVSAGSNSGTSGGRSCSVTISRLSYYGQVNGGANVSGSGDWQYYDDTFDNNVGGGTNNGVYWYASRSWSGDRSGWRGRVWSGGWSSGNAKIVAYN